MIRLPSLALLACLSVLTTIVTGALFSQNQRSEVKGTTAGDRYRPFLINNVFNYYGNNGDGSLNPFDTASGNEGFEFPKGSGKHLVYEDGIVWCGYIQGRPAIGGSEYLHALQPGAILIPGSGGSFAVPDDPTLPKYRMYRVRPEINPRLPFADVEARLDTEEVQYISRYEMYSAQDIYDQYIRDWHEWPADLGAPFTYGVGADGKQRSAPASYDPNYDTPGEPGADQTLWHVSNDLSATRDMNFGGYSSSRIGLEMQRAIWGIRSAGRLPGYSLSFLLDQMVFIRTILINKSGKQIDSMYLAQWADPDIGGMVDAGNNFEGCDTSLGLGYVYNGAAVNSAYNRAVPAVGYTILEGPLVPSPGGRGIFRWLPRPGYKNLGMEAFCLGPPPASPYSDPVWLDPHGQMAGYSFLDPTTGKLTKFMLNGDPVMRTGWVDGTFGLIPRDVRIQMSCGPFTMMPGDTAELIVANVAGVSPDFISSIIPVRVASGLAMFVYQSEIQSGPTTVSILSDQRPPASFHLMQNHPNPFNPFTTIRYGLPHKSDMSLVVYNTLGQLVSTLVKGDQEAGSYEVRFDGSGLASGVYFYRFKAGSFVQTKKLLLLR